MDTDKDTVIHTDMDEVTVKVTDMVTDTATATNTVTITNTVKVTETVTAVSKHRKVAKSELSLHN